MTPASVDGLAESSTRKQLLLAQYANGVLTWRQVAEEIAKIQPPAAKLSKLQRIVMVVAAGIAVALIPPWAKKDDV